MLGYNLKFETGGPDYARDFHGRTRQLLDRSDIGPETHALVEFQQCKLISWNFLRPCVTLKRFFTRQQSFAVV